MIISFYIDILLGFIIVLFTYFSYYVIKIYNIIASIIIELSYIIINTCINHGKILKTIFVKYLTIIANNNPIIFDLIGVCINLFYLLKFMYDKLIEMRKFIVSIRFVIFILFINDFSLDIYTYIIFIDSLSFIYIVYTKYINPEFPYKYPKIHLYLETISNISYIISIFINIYTVFMNPYINPTPPFPNNGNNGQGSNNNGGNGGGNGGPGNDQPNSMSIEEQRKEKNKKKKGEINFVSRLMRTNEQRDRINANRRRRYTKLTEEQKERIKENANKEERKQKKK
jgi:hypothetical protein